MNIKSTTIWLLLCTAALLLPPGCKPPNDPPAQAVAPAANHNPPPDPHHLPPAIPFLPPGTLETYRWRGFPSLLFQEDLVWALCPTGCLLLCQNGQVLDAWQKRGQGPGEFIFPYSFTLDGEGNLVVCDTTKTRLLFFHAVNGKIRFLREKTLPASATSTAGLHFCQGQWIASGTFFSPRQKPKSHEFPQAPLALLSSDFEVERVLDWPNILPSGTPFHWSYSAFLLEEAVMAGPLAGLEKQFSLHLLGPDFQDLLTLDVPNPGRYDLASLRKGYQTAEFHGADTPPGCMMVEILLYEKWGVRDKYPFSLTHHLFDRQGTLLASWPSKRFLIRGVMGNRDNAYYTYDVDELQIYRHPLS